MATYKPKRKISSGTEDVKLPIASIDGLQNELTSLGDALKPQLISTAVSANNAFEFKNVTKQGLAVLSFGYTNTFINIYGLTAGQTYKQSGTFVYNSAGSVITTTINVMLNNNTLKVWSGDWNYSIINGYTGYLFVIPLA